MVASWAAGGTPRLSAGLGLVGGSVGSWGSPNCSARLGLPKGGTLEVSWRRRQGLFPCIAFLGFSGSLASEACRKASVAAWWQSRGAFHGCVYSWGNASEALQFPGLWENTSSSPEVSHRPGLLVVQLWVRVGWPKAPCEGQTKPKLTRGRPAPAHITYLFHCSTHTCWKLSILHSWSITSLGCGALLELDTPSLRYRSP